MIVGTVQWVDANLVVVHVTRQIDVVNPNLRCLLNTNSISGLRKYLRDSDVTDDDIRLLIDAETNALESYNDPQPSAY